MFTMMIVVLGGAGLAAGTLGLYGFVTGARERDYMVVPGSLLALAAGAGFGWMAFQVASVDDAITTSRVDRARAVNCTAEILNAKDERVRINETDVYRFRVRVQIPGKAPYETDSIGAVPPLLAGRIGTDRAGYACLADRLHLDQVEILWDHPIR
ncbi:hypothetical protein ACFVH6_38070 [Spirillospora sp. NPDC127200]